MMHLFLLVGSSAQVPAAPPAAKVVTVPAAAPAPVAAPQVVDLQCKAVRNLYAAVGTVDTRVSDMLSVHCCDLSDVRCNNVREPAAHGPTHSTHTALLTRACPTTQLADMTHNAPAGGWGAPGTFEVERVKLRGGASKPSGTLPSAASIWDGLKSLSELDLGKDSKSDLSGTIPPAIAALAKLEELQLESETLSGTVRAGATPGERSNTSTPHTRSRTHLLLPHLSPLAHPRPDPAHLRQVSLP